MAKTRNGVIAALDIGTSKVVCFVARVDGQGLRVVGIGHQPAQGMRSGNIVDMEAATRAISSAVSTAEEMCGEHVREVIVGVSGGSAASHNQSLDVAIGHHEIGERDVRRVQQHIHLPAETADRDIIHSEAIGYSVDGTPVRDARGMFGERLGVDVHLVTAASGAMRNLQVCVRRAHLEIAERVVAAHASGLSSLVSDERDLGVTLIDMGGGTTSIAVFYEGHLVHVDTIPVGGEHVTRDIARGLSTPLAHADRMKTQIGRAVAKPNDEYDIIDVPLIGEEDRTRPNHIPRSILVGIIRPRIEETFELVRNRLEASGVDKLAGGRAGHRRRRLPARRRARGRGGHPQQESPHRRAFATGRAGGFHRRPGIFGGRGPARLRAQPSCRRPGATGRDGGPSGSNWAHWQLD